MERREGATATTAPSAVPSVGGSGSLAASSTATSTPTAVEAPPVLSRPIVDLGGTFDAGTARLGALHCAFTFPNDPNDRWCFNAFGSTAVPGKRGVSLDYKVAAGASVYAATAGTVVAVEEDRDPRYAGEFEVRTQPGGGAFLVIYDHVRQPGVAVGATVAAGQVLGSAGRHTGDPARFGRVELQVNHYPDILDRRRSEAWCPQSLGTAAFRAANEAALAAHNAANPVFAASAVCLQDKIAAP